MKIKIDDQPETTHIVASKTDLEILEEKENATVEDGDGTKIESIAVAQTLEVDGDKYGNEIKTLVEWAKQKTGSEDYMDLKWAVRDLRIKLGTPTFGDPIKNMARFAQLDLDESRIKKEKESFR